MKCESMLETDKMQESHRTAISLGEMTQHWPRNIFKRHFGNCKQGSWKGPQRCWSSCSFFRTMSLLTISWVQVVYWNTTRMRFIDCEAWQLLGKKKEELYAAKTRAQKNKTKMAMHVFRLFRSTTMVPIQWLNKALQSLKRHNGWLSQSNLVTV